MVNVCLQCFNSSVTKVMGLRLNTRIWVLTRFGPVSRTFGTTFYSNRTAFGTVFTRVGRISTDVWENQSNVGANVVGRRTFDEKPRQHHPLPISTHATIHDDDNI
jgi:hypothetical protein